MLHTCGHDIDTGGVDAAVTENIRQLGDILLDAVEGPGKKLPEIVGKYFGCLHLCPFAQVLHPSPDAGTVYRYTVFIYEDHAVFDLSFSGEIHQYFSQFPRKQDRPGLILAADKDAALFDHFQSEVLQL